MEFPFKQNIPETNQVEIFLNCVPISMQGGGEFLNRRARKEVDWFWGKVVLEDMFLSLKF